MIDQEDFVPERRERDGSSGRRMLVLTCVSCGSTDVRLTHRSEVLSRWHCQGCGMRWKDRPEAGEQTVKLF